MAEIRNPDSDYHYIDDEVERKSILSDLDNSTFNRSHALVILVASMLFFIVSI